MGSGASKAKADANANAKAEELLKDQSKANAKTTEVPGSLGNVNPEDNVDAKEFLKDQTNMYEAFVNDNPDAINKLAENRRINGQSIIDFVNNQYDKLEDQEKTEITKAALNKLNLNKKKFQNLLQKETDEEKKKKLNQDIDFIKNTGIPIVKCKSKKGSMNVEQKCIINDVEHEWREGKWLVKVQDGGRRKPRKSRKRRRRKRKSRRRRNRTKKRQRIRNRTKRRRIRH